MKIEDIKKQLKKEKNPLKYLQDLIKKTKDKKLKEQIEKLLEELKKPKKNLEDVVRRAHRLELKEEEIEERPRTDIRASQNIALNVERRNEDYGIRVGKGDYSLGVEKLRKDLETSQQTVRDGFLANTETQGLFDRKAGEYNIEQRKSYQNERGVEYRKEEFIRENINGLTSIEKEIKKKKKEKNLPDYI